MQLTFLNPKQLSCCAYFSGVSLPDAVAKLLLKAKTKQCFSFFDCVNCHCWVQFPPSMQQALSQWLSTAVVRCKLHICRFLCFVSPVYRVISCLLWKTMKGICRFYRHTRRDRKPQGCARHPEQKHVPEEHRWPCGSFTNGLTSQAAVRERKCAALLKRSRRLNASYGWLPYVKPDWGRELWLRVCT